MTVSPLRKSPMGLPGRQPLCEAILAAAKAREEMTAIKAAVERAEGLVAVCRRKVEAARETIATAKAQDVEDLASALVRGAGTTPLQTIRRAREEEVEATNSLAAARAALTRLVERDLKDAEHEVERADKAVRAAIAAVLKPTAQKMIEEAKHFRAEYLTRMFAVGVMVDGGLGVERVRFDISPDEYRQYCAAVGRTWETAIKALREDADAPLPNDTPPT